MEDVAAAYAFLASDDAAFIHGSALVIDGGQLAGRCESGPDIGQALKRHCRGMGVGSLSRPAAYRWLWANAIVAFWFAYIVTRPLGASFADWLALAAQRGRPRGLGHGVVSLVSIDHHHRLGCLHGCLRQGRMVRHAAPGPPAWSATGLDPGARDRPLPAGLGTAALGDAAAPGRTGTRSVAGSRSRGGASRWG